MSRIPPKSPGQRCRYKARLKELIREVCEENRVEIIELEIMLDPVHLLMEAAPQFGIHRAVKLLKGRTPRVLRQKSGWLRPGLPSPRTNSYFVSTADGAPLAVIRQYVKNQKNAMERKA